MYMALHNYSQPSFPGCGALKHLTLTYCVQLGPIDLGRIYIQYRRVNCKPPVNMMVTVDSNSGEGGWIRMNVQVDRCTG